MAPPLLEMGPDEHDVRRSCSVAGNQRTSRLSLLLLDVELHRCLWLIADGLGN